MNTCIHILHLEDDTRDAELVQTTLQSAEIACQVTRVQGREDFTQAIHQGGYDLILADYHLPDYDGMSALRLAQERCPETPFIFVSGVLGEDAAIEALTQGAIDYVLKHKLARLAPAVTRALREAENRKERKRAEEALQNSQEQLALIIDTLPALIGYVDSEQRYLYVNQRYADWYGSSKEELVGKHLKEVVYEKSYQGIVKHVQAVLQGQEVSFENISYDLEGQLRAVMATYAPHFDENGQVKAFLGLVQDITEQKRAEEALRDSEERYRAIFEQAADSIVLVDVGTGALVEFNDRAHENLGYTREEFEKLKIPDFEVIESAEEVAKHIEKILKEGADTFETKHRAKGGEIRDILVSSRAISISGRDLAQSIWKDITERKRAEEQIRTSLREKEVLLQELYHRTKNNMTVIGAMLSMQAENLDDQRLTRILEELKQRIISMAMVHEQLYESQDLSHVNLRKYTRQLADSLLANYHISPGKIALKVDVEPIVVLIETAIPYGLIVNELMTNALKYAFPEGRDGEIRIALRRLPGEQGLELRFCDNGIGLPEDLDIRKTQSFGMKLITLLIDMQFKGTVDVQANTGTEFRIRFQELNYKARV